MPHKISEIKKKKILTELKTGGVIFFYLSIFIATLHTSLSGLLDMIYVRLFRKKKENEFRDKTSFRVPSFVATSQSQQPNKTIDIDSHNHSPFISYA